MAIDTAAKRRTAASVSVLILPAPSGSVDETARAVLGRSYLLSAITVVVTTPLARIYAIARELRRYAIGGG